VFTLLSNSKETMSNKIPFDRLLPEFQFLTSRSSGPGGQNVNKVESKVTLKWNIRASLVLTDHQKVLLMEKLSNKINQEGELVIHAEMHRSQLQNKELVIKKLEQLLIKATYQPKARKATKPSKSAVAKRILSKKRQGEKKQWRQKPD